MENAISVQSTTLLALWITSVCLAQEILMQLFAPLVINFSLQIVHALPAKAPKMLISVPYAPNSTFKEEFASIAVRLE
jgi:hypothetical protein